MIGNVILLGADNNRTRAYLSILCRDGMAPSCLVLLNNNGPAAPQKNVYTELFDNITPAAKAAAIACVSVIEVTAESINDSVVAETLNGLDQDIVIFSGYGGAIIGASLFATGKRFLHVHPGKLPEFRGSTTIYYSLLTDNKVWASALLMAPEIDGGPIVGVRCFEPPKDRKLIDMTYDPYVRSCLLRDVMENYVKSGEFEEVIQSHVAGGHYFIIHPVLKHAAILSRGVSS